LSAAAPANANDAASGNRTLALPAPARIAADGPFPAAIPTCQRRRRRSGSLAARGIAPA